MSFPPNYHKTLCIAAQAKNVKELYWEVECDHDYISDINDHDFFIRSIRRFLITYKSLNKLTFALTYAGVLRPERVLLVTRPEIIFYEPIRDDLINYVDGITKLMVETKVQGEIAKRIKMSVAARKEQLEDGGILRRRWVEPKRLGSHAREMCFFKRVWWWEAEKGQVLRVEKEKRKAGEVSGDGKRRKKNKLK